MSAECLQQSTDQSFRSVVPIDTKTQDDYYKALNVIFRQYNKGKFVIKTIYCDGEYHAMMNKVSDDLDVVMNYTNASDRNEITAQ